MKEKVKATVLSLLWGLIVIAFTVASGVVCSVVSGIDTREEIWLVQGVFSWLSLLPAALYIRRKGLTCPLLKGADKTGLKRCLYYIPCVLILAPMLINGFADETAYYFLSSLFFTLGVGVSEELYFRGIVTDILGKSFSADGVIFLSAVIFGLGHSSAALSGMNGFMVVMTVINALIFGWLAAELLYSAKILFPLMIFHFLFDYLSKAAPLGAETEMTVDLIRGALMFIFAAHLFIARKISRKQKESA